MTDPGGTRLRTKTALVARHRGWWTVAAMLVSLPFSGGCGPRSTAYPAALNSPRSDERIRAIGHAAETRDDDAIPLLIDRLEDEDSAVRLYAILGLEKLTGTRQGYRYEAGENERKRAVLRWRRWAEQRATTAPDGPRRPACPSSSGLP